jgi:tetratricopeptide (TPR) repeat protein
MDRSAIKIMIVNDKVELRNIIRDYLKNEGYSKLVVSENGRSAFRRADYEVPDLIIADRDLPDLSGMDLLKEIRHSPRLADTLFILLTSEIEQKYIAQAAEHKVSAVLVKPFSHQILADKVNRLLEDRLEPPLSRQNYEEANRLASEGKLEEALAKYQEAVSSTKKSMAAVHYRMGQVHEKMDRDDTAEADYHEAIGMSRVYVDAYDALGDLNLRLDRPDDALPFFKQGTEISPMNARRQRRLGEALLESGDFEGAEKAFKMALDLDPTQTHLFNRLGIALRRQGKLAEAGRYFLQAVEVTPEDENLLYNLSRVYLDQGESGEAVGYLRKALDLNPDFSEARDLLESLGPQTENA